MGQRYAMLLAIFFMALLTSSSADDFTCYKYSHENRAKEDENDIESCLNDKGCFKVVVDKGVGNRIFHRGCINAVNYNAYCKTEAVDRFGGGGIIEYCGVCKGNKCNGSSSLSSFNVLVVLLPCLLGYFFSK